MHKNILNTKSINCRLLFIFLILSCLTSSNIVAQKHFIEITNSKNKRVKKIREKKKITVYTKDLKIKGFLKILDNETILIKDTEIKVSDIIAIKNKTILVKLLSIIVLPIATITAFMTTAFLSPKSDAPAIIGITGISAILLSTQLKKNYKSERYKFKIIYE